MGASLMHVLTLFVEGVATPFSLHYRGDGTCAAAKSRILATEWNEQISLQDDFGQNVILPRAGIKVIVLLDVAQGLEAQLALMEVQQRAQRRVPGQSGIMMPANMPGIRQ
jgi:hypothetical protein